MVSPWNALRASLIRFENMPRSVLAIFILWSLPFSLAAAELYFVDAHSQYERELEGDEIIKYMDKAGVRQAIISTRRGRGPWDAVELADNNPDRIIPSVRIKGKHYTRNTKKYFKKLNKQVNSGEFKAMSEVHMFHAQKGDKADEVEVHVNDDRIQKTLSAAIDNGWPFVVHIEFSSLSNSDAQGFMKELETLLIDNPNHPFVLIHMGQLDESRVERLLVKYKNIHFFTSHADPVSVSGSNQPWVNMFDDENLKPQWKALMIKCPDQFIFAIDAVWADQWRFDYVRHANLWRNALAAVPEDIANKVAHGNAERLWGLK